MDTFTISRRNHANNKGNKENAQPPTGAKSFIKTGKTPVPFQTRGNKKEDALNKEDSLQAKGKQVDKKTGFGEAHRKLQRDAKGLSAGIKAQTLKSAIAEAPKQSSKSALGKYKGRIVQSKIGSIWKSSDSLNAAVPKPPAPKPEDEKVSDMAKKNRSKYVAEVFRQTTKRPVPMRSKSVSDKPHGVTRSTASNCQSAEFCSTQHTRTLTATLPSATSRITTVVPVKPGGNQNTKPKIPVTEKKASKPVVSSTLTQYRVAMETAEEKRAKLAEWLASKGKTLKRPAMATIARPKNKVSSKVKVDSKVPDNVELQPAVQCKAEPHPSLKVHDLEHEIPAETQREEIREQSRTLGIMSRKLDLLDDSEADLSEPQGRVDDIVVNLCDALEAMVTPSRSSDFDAQCYQPEEYRSAEQKDEQFQAEKIRKESEVKDQKVKQKDVEEHKDGVNEVESSDDDVMETPQTDASVIRYSVKTTPYLQSLKKTILDKVSTSRKSNIKDLKFLTPVRRSSRIQHKASHLPSMLTDHDPSVLSLVELVQLDDDPNAYIYRKNPALLQELPDQNKL